MASEIEYKKGDIVLFADYADEVKADTTFQPILEAGQVVRIERIADDGGIVVTAIDEEGNIITDDKGEPVADTVFPEELGGLTTLGGEATEEDAAATDAPVAEETKAEAPVAEAEKPKRSAGKKPAAEPAPKAPTKAEEKAKAKADAAAEKEAAAKKKAEEKAAQAKAKEDAKKQKEAEKQAAAEAKLAKPDNDDPMMIRVEETPSVLNVLKSEKSALDAAKMLVNRSEQTDFTLGGVLHNIYVTGAFKTLGYDGKRGFSDYVEKELGVAYRKARYLISIYTTFAQVFRAKGITEEDLLKLGWSKAKELARIPVDMLVRDYDALIAMASDKEKPRDDLISYIKENYEVVQREETVKAIDLKFRLVADAADVVNDALKKAQTLAGDGADMNKALEYMAGDWLQTAESQNTMTLQSLIDLAFVQFGVTLSEAPADAATQGAADEAEQAA